MPWRSLQDQEKIIKMKMCARNIVYGGLLSEDPEASLGLPSEFLE